MSEFEQGSLIHPQRDDDERAHRAIERLAAHAIDRSTTARNAADDPLAAQTFVALGANPGRSVLDRRRVAERSPDPRALDASTGPRAASG